MSIQKRGDSWTATVYDPVERRKVWVGTYPSKSDAREAEHLAWKRVKQRKRGHRETVESFAARWMADYPRNRESTRRNHADKVRRFARDFGPRQLGSIERVEARAWALRHRGDYPSVRAMYSDALRDGLVDDNPFLKLGFESSRGRRDLVVPTEGELGEMVLTAGRLLGDYGRRVVGPFIQFGAYSGLRPGELYGLERSKIDVRGRTILVDCQWNQRVQRVTETKNGLSRTIFLTPQAEEAANACPRVRAEVFSAPRGGRLAGTIISAYWRPIVHAVGRPEFTPHCLRHFYGTHLARLGMSAPDIARQLGHTDGGRLALERYVHIGAEESNERVARAFGSHVRDLRAVGG